MAQKPHIPDDDKRAKVREYATNGVDHDSIGAAIGISDETLRKYYRTELDECGHVFKADFASSIGRDVRRFDCPPALRIFAAKVKLGWRETVAIDPLRETPAGELGIGAIRTRVAQLARDARERSADVGADSPGPRRKRAA